jgi:hypothetical protein
MATLGRGKRRNDEEAEARGGGEHAEISDDMAPGRRDGGREACQKGQGLHLYCGGTVAERFFEEQAYAPVGSHLQSLVGDGRTKYICDQCHHRPSWVPIPPGSPTSTPS